MATRKSCWGEPIWVTEGGAELPGLNIAVSTALMIREPDRYFSEWSCPIWSGFSRSRHLPTKIVLEELARHADKLEEVVEATFGLATPPELEDVTGRFFDRRSEARASARVYDAEARRRLWNLSLELVGEPG